MPPQITCASGKTVNTIIVFFTHCISALPEFSQSLLGFFNVFLTHNSLTDSPNLVINAFSSGLLGAWFSRERCSSWTVLHDNASLRYLLCFLFRKVLQKH